MIYTFYSYKGGVGRSMAVANVAQWLCIEGFNVLMVDWDLEAPGLEEFFYDRPEDIERASEHPGLMDSLLAYKRTYPTIKPQLVPSVDADPASQAAAVNGQGDTAETLSRRKRNAMLLKELLPPLSDAILAIGRPSISQETSGSIKLLTAGWRAGAHFQHYAAAVQSFDWAEFYALFDGEAYFDWLRDALQAEADVVLVDSRTGVTEMGGVCTRHLADVVVCLCAPNRQNLRGLVDMIRSFQRSALLEARGRSLEVVAVPTRIENSEISLLNQFSTEFNRRLDEFTPEAFKKAQRTFWDLRIPYVPRYAYSETLAVGVSDTASDLELAYKTLAAHLLLLAPKQLLDRASPSLASAVKSILPREQESPPRRILMSYGADAAPVAKALRERLKGVTIETWSGNHSIAIGASWKREIVDALTQSQVLVAIITPDAVASRVVLQVMRRARSQGLLIVPVLGAPIDALDFEALPAFVKSYHLFDPEHEWDALVEALRSGEPAPRPPFMAPPLPEQGVWRVVELERLVTTLVSVGGAQSPASWASRHGVSLVGVGGVGKTVLAAAACHDARIVDEFYDGIMWTTLGQIPDLQSALTTLYASLTSERPAFLSVADAAASFHEALGSKRCLIVLDDVWNEAHLQPFLRGGDRCAVLITTRNHDVTRVVPDVAEIQELDPSEATRMLASYLEGGATGEYEDAFRDLAERLGRLPLLLRLTGSVLRERIARGDSVERALEYAHRTLDKRGITAFDRRGAVGRDQALSQTLELSLEQLTTEERDQCAVLAAFPEDQAIPLTWAQEFWGMDDVVDAEDVAQTLHTLSLVQLDFRSRTIHLHPVVREFLRESLRNLEGLQRRASELMERNRSQ